MTEKLDIVKLTKLNFTSQTSNDHEERNLNLESLFSPDNSKHNLLSKMINNSLKQQITNKPHFSKYDVEKDYFTTKSEFHDIQLVQEPENQFKSKMIFKKIEDFKIEAIVEDREEKINYKHENKLKIKIIQNYLSKQEYIS